MHSIRQLLALSVLGLCLQATQAEYVFEPGHPSLQGFLLGEVPYPADNVPNAARVELGHTLFFDTRMSGDGNMSCASCHNPALGWSDGLPTARGDKSAVLGRASPTVFNTAYNSIQMWDGRKKSLEEQAMGPMQASTEMNMDITKLFQWLNSSPGYQALFARAYPGEGINESTLSKAIASFERTVVSRNSPFDRWVQGDAKALTPQQVEGFRLFAGKAHCVACHSGANFTDNGFHNLGLKSWGDATPDLGRYAQKPVNAMRGAFKTPTLREIARTAPYFHDGSARSLLEVVELYDRGGEVKTNLSPNLQPLGLTSQEKRALVAFLQALSSPFLAVTMPELPTP
ncbi:MAG: c-type cytochrome [Rhodoferax sp.]|nr:c-type cytochrome [Rhodoferax sp.]